MLLIAFLFFLIQFISLPFQGELNSSHANRTTNQPSTKRLVAHSQSQSNTPDYTKQIPNDEHVNLITKPYKEGDNHNRLADFRITLTSCVDHWMMIKASQLSYKIITNGSNWYITNLQNIRLCRITWHLISSNNIQIECLQGFNNLGEYLATELNQRYQSLGIHIEVQSPTTHERLIIEDVGTNIIAHVLRSRK